MANKNHIDAAIFNHMKKTYNLAIGIGMADRIKTEIGLARMRGDDSKMEVSGRDMLSAAPRKAVVTFGEIREVLGRGN